MDKKQVFISYKSEEFDEANWVKTVLETNGISCWMAPMCITGGSSYAVEIPQAIRNCKVFVLILSEKSQTSKWVPREVDQAINENKIIMPFMLENCKLKDDFNFYLTNVQRYAAYESKLTAIEKMLREIKAILGIRDEPKKEVPKQEAPTQAAPKQEAPKQQIPIQAAPKPANSTQVRSAKSQKSVLTIIGGIVAAIVLLVGVVTLFNKLTHVTIAGEKVKKSTYSVTLRDKIVTQEDLDSISKLKKVNHIAFSDCMIKGYDLGVLCDEKTDYLIIENCALSETVTATLDFDKMTDLTHLNLSGNPSLTKIDGIEAAADTLRYLAINQTNITNLDFLKDFSILEELQADDTGITSVEALGGCKKLYAISVNGNKLTSLKGLENTIQLQSVCAGYNELTGIPELSNNVLLKTVYLNHNKISDISPLKNAVGSLTGLYIDDNQVTDISCLNGFAELQYFSADRNAITDISALKQSTKLDEITISGNKLTSLTGLENCVELDFINVSDNQISDASALSNLTLQGTYGAVVNVGNNKITEIKLKDEVNLSLLNLHGNEISSFLFGANSEIHRIIYDYNDSIDFANLAKTNIKFHYMVDCPLDKKIHLSKSLGSVIHSTPDELQEVSDYSNDEIMGEYLYAPPEKKE